MAVFMNFTSCNSLPAVNVPVYVGATPSSFNVTSGRRDLAKSSSGRS